MFDPLKKGDPHLRLLALGILAGLGVLLAQLWWVQIVSARDYQEDLTTQAFRSVRIPAVRGKILDREGNVLAENRPSYSVCLYLDELRDSFRAEYARLRPKRVVTNSVHFWQKWLGTKAVKSEYVKLKPAEREALMAEARYRAASNVVAEIGRNLRQPLTLNRSVFERHYREQRALPFPVLSNLGPTNIARFEEQCGESLGVNLEVQSARYYPYGTLAAHLVGHLQRDDRAKFGEESYFSYLPEDYRGALGIELAYDKDLRGMAGGKSVQINSMGYRTMETIWTPAEPGQNVVLTLNTRIQQVAERALPVFGPTTSAAAVVMDVNTGDVLALASSPSMDPNFFVRRGDFPRDYYQRLGELQAEKNRATFELYAPGSIFKTIVGLAALEAGLDPNKELYVPENPAERGRGHYLLKSGRSVRDTAAPGNYNFTRALIRSSNTYFITQAVHYGPEGIARITERLHFRERFGLQTAQESKGYTPTLEHVSKGWTEGNTANLAIGQDPIVVTPLQVAVMTAALANGGTVLYPRLVERIEPQDPLLGGGAVRRFPSGVVRDHLGVSARSMAILHKAMLADTEDPEGTGKEAAKAAPGLRICAKTGTAQNQDVHGRLTRHTTWFASFAPFDKPQYAVVVMVDKGASGGGTCAPIAGKIYAAIKQELMDAGKPSAPPPAGGQP